ncbi:MAG: hypothetical protein HFE65_01395 [Clostridiales bacterium]|nr:hypothetical protein [Clostridiales bacterium]
MYQPKSEEEKTQDILFHEMRSDAQDHIDSFSKKHRRVLLITCIAAVLLFAAMCSFMMAAYDNERLYLLVLLVVLYAVLVTLTWFIAGGIVCRSLSGFVRWSAIRSKWIDILSQMDKVEEEYLKGTVYEEDMKKVERRMAALAEAINDMGAAEAQK